MAALSIVRMMVHILTLLVTIIAIGFVSAALLTSGWQIMTEPNTQEIHQHGLWLDYNRIHPHMAGVAAQDKNNEDGWHWTFNYKFGKAVQGDEVHRAKWYQENTLILLSISLILAIIGSLISYCTALTVICGVCWSVCLFVATILAASGIIQFYITAMMPEIRYISSTSGRVEQLIGYSFWWAVVGVIGFALAMIKSIVCNVLQIINNRNGGERTKKAGFVFKSNTQV